MLDVLVSVKERGKSIAETVCHHAWRAEDPVEWRGEGAASCIAEQARCQARGAQRNGVARALAGQRACDVPARAARAPPAVPGVPKGKANLLPHGKGSSRTPAGFLGPGCYVRGTHAGRGCAIAQYKISVCRPAIEARPLLEVLAQECECRIGIGLSIIGVARAPPSRPFSAAASSSRHGV